MRHTRLIIVLLTAAAGAGCNVFGPSESLKAAGTALVQASEQCVYEVRDKKMKYASAPNCVALKALSGRFIDAGGAKPDTPTEIELMFAVARMHAWMAMALSESAEPETLRVW